MEDSIDFTSATYIATNGENVSIEAVVSGVTMNIPIDPANRHYAEILRQVEAGKLTVQDAV
tara:strand:+ start:484 stop:666 length:183 start_codon:yes stop_codon:yes gene_type:complete